MEVTKSGHGMNRLEYHVVWVVKYRRKILKPGVKVEQVGFDKDHVHFVMIIPQRYAIAGAEKPICVVNAPQTRMA